MLKNSSHHYATSLITLHWLVLLAVVATYLFINLHDFAPKGSEFRAAMKYWHFVFGYLVLVLMLIRVAVRAQAGRAPVIIPKPAQWTLATAKLVHITIYFFMIGMPLLGWFALSVGAKDIPFGLPALAQANPDLYPTVKGWHKQIGNWGYWLIGLHAAAAIFHHWILTDSTLRRMLPFKGNPWRGAGH